MDWYQRYCLAEDDGTFVKLPIHTTYLDDQQRQDQRDFLRRRIRRILFMLPVSALLTIPVAMLAERILDNLHKDIPKVHFDPGEVKSLVEEARKEVVIEQPPQVEEQQAEAQPAQETEPRTPIVSGWSEDSPKGMIKRHEGFGPVAYYDPAKERKGKSVGYGYYLNNSSARKDLASVGLDYAKIVSGQQSITEQQASALFDLYYPRAVSHAMVFAGDFDSLPDTIKNVLVDMAYNLGPDRLAGFTQMKAALDNGNWNEMANQMVNSKWYGQVGDRSKELVEMVRNVNG